MMEQSNNVRWAGQSCLIRSYPHDCIEVAVELKELE